jgi:hypothetical protein
MKAEHYLEYLDKEMHILGVLSTFCLAVPSLIIERIASMDDKSLAYDFFATLWCNSGGQGISRNETRAHAFDQIRQYRQNLALSGTGSLL